MSLLRSRRRRLRRRLTPDAERVSSAPRALPPRRRSRTFRCCTLDAALHLDADGAADTPLPFCAAMRRWRDAVFTQMMLPRHAAYA